MDDTSTQSLADMLDQCLEQIAQGASVEECLARFPAQRGELTPLLQVAARMAALPPIQMPAATRIAIESRMLQHVAVQTSPAHLPRAYMSPRGGVPILATVVIGIILVVTVLIASLFFAHPSQPSPTMVPDSRAIASATAVLRTPAASGTPGTMPTPSTIPHITPEAIHAMPTATLSPSQVPIAPDQENHNQTPPDKPCQGKQSGRDDKKCERDKDKDDKDKDDKDKDDKGKDDKGKDDKGKDDKGKDDH